MNDGKVILIDGSVLAFRSIFNWSQMIIKQNQGKIPQNQFIMSSDYTYLSMIISVLKKIKVEKNDIIILAQDGRNSWRKLFYPEYKAQRKEQRDKYEHVDWYAHWGKIDKINQTLRTYSHIYVMKLDYNFSYEDLLNSKEGMKFLEPDAKMFDNYYSVEGDDIIAQACHYYKNKECIVVTIDKDLYQLDYLPNVKIFSMNLKTPKGKNGAYVVNCDPLKILADKCRLGDVSDNIIIDKNNPEKDSEVRKFIIDVLNPPSFLKAPIENELKNIKPKINHFEKLPFVNSLAKRFKDIYTDKNHVSWDYCKSYFEKKKRKKKTKRKKLNKGLSKISNK